jgi:hypothetical protein
MVEIAAVKPTGPKYERESQVRRSYIECSTIRLSAVFFTTFSLAHDHGAVQTDHNLQQEREAVTAPLTFLHGKNSSVHVDSLLL